MRRLTSILIAIIAMFAAALPALAQTPAASPEAEPYTGLREGVTRQYASDPAAMPADNPETFALVSVHLFRFDTGDHAAAMWTRLTDDATSGIPGQRWDGGTDPEIHEGDVDDLGDQAWAVSFSATNPDGDTGHIRMLYVQDGAWVILATGMGGTEQVTMLADDLARAVTDRDASSGTARFSADGTSTGGIWARLPLTGEADAHGLTAYSDREIALP